MHQDKYVDILYYSLIKRDGIYYASGRLFAEFNTGQRSQLEAKDVMRRELKARGWHWDLSHCEMVIFEGDTSR